MRKIDYKKSGVVFNIQKFSVNDGPGIRTVVFLKGCPLRCLWCANPESQLSKVQILWNHQKCIHCHHCIDICPSKAITLSNGHIHVDAAKCKGCLQCVQICPGKALEKEGEMKTVQEVIDVVIQDKAFYEESGGGITLSGGEILSQPAFATELLLAAKEKGLHTCCETTGFGSASVFDQVIEYVDYMLFDLKHWNSVKHKQGTGVTNELILENLKHAANMGKTILTRLPVIPDFNNTLTDAQGFVKILQEIGVWQIQLLPFHQFGENKYDLLDRPYFYTDVPALHREDLEQFRNVFLEAGIDAFF